ncbi:MAG TPA: beta-ketoacyl-ACP synthase [Oligoflexia bacterium]|nr:beta-ketoacyl-ACP synthase [Oligoflexia bacterium]HMP49869.1 beta-ketoacyl-ACP synthase [Oligoflexia bacterium]
MRRVVVSGIGLLSPLGLGLSETLSGIYAGLSGVRYQNEWDEYQGLKTRLGAPLPEFKYPDNWSPKAVRSMGRAALIALYATQQALDQAGILKEDPLLSSGRLGIAYGSGTGSPEALSHVCNFMFNKSIKGITSTTYHKMMSHTCAANLGLFYGIRGRVIPSSSACTSGSLGIGYAFESIRTGLQDVMIAGGSEEFAPSIAAIFDVLYACSLKNDFPNETPRPFDKNRDGLVVGEGACTLILEDLEHAISRGVRPLAEIVGFGTNSDGFHITSPLQETVEECMHLSLKDANLCSSDIGYINAHATGTPVGDVVESVATSRALPSNPPISSLKGHIGHLLGASGAAEIALTIAMMNSGRFAPTRNLESPDSECAEIDYIINEVRSLDIEYAMSNTFAFGGINTSLILKKMI